MRIHKRFRVCYVASMPIRPELRAKYPPDWALISQAVRFGRAKGRCEQCKRPHGQLVEVTKDGRWCDGEVWRDGHGRIVAKPNDPTTFTRVYLSAAHLDHDPSTRNRRALKALCQRCHLIHDRPEHLRRRRLTYLRRYALGDLFTGPYEDEVYFAGR